MPEHDAAVVDQLDHSDDPGDQQHPAPVQERGADRDLLRVEPVGSDGVTVGALPDGRIDEQARRVEDRCGDEAEPGDRPADSVRVGEQ
nr:hypothetical protein GCM10020093_051060 [Planobispora longispora]